MKIIVAGLSVTRLVLDAARRFGAATIVNVGNQNLLDAVRKESDGVGVDVAVEYIGHFGARLY